MDVISHSLLLDAVVFFIYNLGPSLAFAVGNMKMRKDMKEIIN